MRSKPYIKEEPYLVIVLVAILSAPVLGVVLSGCSQKNEPGVTLGKIIRAEDANGAREGVSTRAVLDPASRKLKAREAVERARKAARSKVEHSTTKEVSNSAQPRQEVDTGSNPTLQVALEKKAEGPAAGLVESAGKKESADPAPGGNEAIDRESSPALQSANRLIEIFEATEKALPESR